MTTRSIPDLGSALILESVSVVITVYNKRKYLARALDSVLGQTYSPIEVIVIDDFSEEDHLDIIESFNNPKIRYIRLGENKGQSHGANLGFSLAKGDLVALLDADDYWLTTKLEAQVAALKASSNPARTVCTCRMRLISPGQGEDEGKVRPSSAFEGGPKKIIPYLTCTRGVIQTSTMLLPANIARAVGFDDELRSLADIGFCFRLARANVSILMLAEPLTVWWDSPAITRVSRAVGLRDRAFARMNEKYREYMSDREWTGLLLRYDNRRPAKFYERLSYSGKCLGALLKGSISVLELFAIYLPRCFQRLGSAK